MIKGNEESGCAALCSTETGDGAVMELIKRLEAAPGPDRELDRDIDLAVLNPLGHKFQQYPGMVFHASGKGHVAAHYTSSIDAALSLDPCNAYPILMAALAHAAAFFVNFRDTTNAPILRMLPSFICAAALKARSAQDPRQAPTTHPSNTRT